MIVKISDVTKVVEGKLPKDTAGNVDQKYIDLLLEKYGKPEEKTVSRQVGKIAAGTKVQILNYNVNSDGSVEFDLKDMTNPMNLEHLNFDKESEIDVW